MPKRFQVGEQLWWVDSEDDWKVQKVEVTEVGDDPHCTIYVSPPRFIYYVEHCMLYREEGAALLAVTTALSKQIEKATQKLDALFEKRKAFQQRLYPESQGTNTHGKFQPGQEIWWWEEVHLELHRGKLDKILYGNCELDYRWQVETIADRASDGRPFLFTIVPVSNIYTNLEDARLKITKMLYDKAKAAVAEAQKFDEAHLRLLKL